MKLKHLTLYLHEGLANRMRVMASAYKFVKQGIKVTIHWALCNELNCNFEKLFEPIEGFNIVNVANEKILKNTNQSNPLKRVLAKILAKKDGYDYIICGGFNNKDSINGEFIKNVFNNYENVYLETCGTLSETDYTIFKPTKEILSAINQLPISQEGNYVGIHIRRGDNIKSQINSRIIPFIERINSDIEAGNKKFFLATDSLDIKDFLTYHFGTETINSIESDFSRNSEKGIKDALIEMLLLSKAKKIIGSYWSSFDEVAAKLGNCKLEKIEQ